MDRQYSARESRAPSHQRAPSHSIDWWQQMPWLWTASCLYWVLSLVSAGLEYPLSQFWNIPLVSSGISPWSHLEHPLGHIWNILLVSWGQLSQLCLLLTSCDPSAYLPVGWGERLKGPWFSANITYKKLTHECVPLFLSQTQQSTLPATRKKSHSMPSKIRTDISISYKWLKITFVVILSHLFLSSSQEK